MIKRLCIQNFKEFEHLEVPDIGGITFDGALQARAEKEFRYIRLDRHPDEIVAKTYLHDVLGVALQNGWEVR